MKPERILDLILENSRHPFREPLSFFFNAETKDFYDQTVCGLRDQGFRFVDLNESVAITPEDFNMKLAEVGLTDETGQWTVKDILTDDFKKRGLICRAKLNRMGEKVNEKTVLLIRYNDMFLHDETYSYQYGGNLLYDLVGTLLKDGIYPNGTRSSFPVIALVYCETDENLRELSMFGYRCFKKN